MDNSTWVEGLPLRLIKKKQRKVLAVSDCPSEEAQICTLYSYANWDGKHQADFI
jgi:hypothetical protein